MQPPGPSRVNLHQLELEDELHHHGGLIDHLRQLQNNFANSPSLQSAQRLVPERPPAPLRGHTLHRVSHDNPYERIHSSRQIFQRLRDRMRAHQQRHQHLHSLHVPRIAVTANQGAVYRGTNIEYPRPVTRRGGIILEDQEHRTLRRDQRPLDDGERRTLHRIMRGWLQTISVIPFLRISGREYSRRREDMQIVETNFSSREELMQAFRERDGVGPEESTNRVERQVPPTELSGLEHLDFTEEFIPNLQPVTYNITETDSPPSHIDSTDQEQMIPPMQLLLSPPELTLPPPNSPDLSRSFSLPNSGNHSSLQGNFSPRPRSRSDTHTNTPVQGLRRSRSRTISAFSSSLGGSSMHSVAIQEDHRVYVLENRPSTIPEREDEDDTEKEEETSATKRSRFLRSLRYSKGVVMELFEMLGKFDDYKQEDIYHPPSDLSIESEPPQGEVDLDDELRFDIIHLSPVSSLIDLSNIS